MKNTKNTCLNLLRLVFLGIFLSSSAFAQAQTWQYFQNQNTLPKFVPTSSTDANGNFWLSSGSLLEKFNGTSWETHDFQAAGINVQYNYIRSMAHAPDGKIWCGTFDRVLEFDPATDTWVLHNPSSGVNVNGFDIMVDQTGKVWWTTTNGWYEWTGSSWSWQRFYFPGPQGQDIVEYSLRHIISDPAGTPWMFTSGTLAIETGIITPAGVIHATTVDTTIYKFGQMGFPEAMYSVATTNNQGYPIAAIFNTPVSGHPHILSYEFGAWQDLGATQSVIDHGADMAQDLVGNVWLAGLVGQTQPVVIRRYPNGVWEKYLLDNQQITNIYTVTATPDGRLWVGGQNTNNGNQGVLAMLPVQAISGTTEISTECPDVSAFLANDLLQFQNVKASDVLEVSAIDIQGRKIASFVLTGTESQIAVAHWPKGIYFLTIQGKNSCPPQAIKILIP